MSATKIKSENNIPKDFFLGIGISEYMHFPHLQNPINDLDAICDLLIENYGLKKEYINILVNEHATRKRILKTLKGYPDLLKEEDRLILYFSGHGEYERRFKNTYWIPYEGEVEDDTTWISDFEIINILEGIECKHVLFISDSCFGANFLSVDKGGELSYQISELHNKPSRWGLAPGLGLVQDGIFEDNSPFVKVFLNQLRKNSTNIPISILRARMFEEFKKLKIKQTPVAGRIWNILPNNSGEFVFFIDEKNQQSSLEITISPEITDTKIQLTEWQEIKKTNNYRLYFRFLNYYPNGKFSKEALKKYNDIVPIFPDMIKVNEGVFLMGDCTGDGNDRNEKPVEKVYINSFEISDTPITNKLYYRFCNDTNLKLPERFRINENLPITFVSWIDAIKFCNWLTEQYQFLYPEKKIEKAYEIKKSISYNSPLNEFIKPIQNANGFRLPSESEWEYAAKGGKHFDKDNPLNFAGSKDLEEVGWYMDSFKKFDWELMNVKKKSQTNWVFTICVVM